MPFTLAHAVVALPFRRARRWSAAGVAAGSMAPDVPLFLPWPLRYETTHSWPAVPTVDVGLGLLLLVLWWGLLRPGIAQISGARPPVPQHSRVLWLLASVTMGTATHVVWDAFTHAGRLGTQLIPALGARLGPFAATSWLQYASGAFGLGVLLVVALRAYLTSPYEIRPPRGRRQAAATATVVAIAAVAALAGGLTASDTRDAVFESAVVAIRTVVVLIAAAGVAHRLSRTRIRGTTGI